MESGSEIYASTTQSGEDPKNEGREKGECACVRRESLVQREIAGG